MSYQNTNNSPDMDSKKKKSIRHAATIPAKDSNQFNDLHVDTKNAQESV